MKRFRRFNLIIPIFIVLAISYSIGRFFDILGFLGFLMFMFFGMGGVATSMIGSLKKSRDKRMLSIPLVIFFPFSVLSLWAGYELMAAGFYNPVLSKSLTAGEWISNHPDPNAVGTFMIAFGLIGLVALNKDRNFRKDARTLYVLIVITVSIFIFSGLSIFYSNSVGEKIIIEGTVSVKNRGLPEFLAGGAYLGGFFVSPRYYFWVDTKERQKLKFYTDRYIFKTLEEGSLVRVVYKNNTKDVQKIMLLKTQRINN